MSDKEPKKQIDRFKETARQLQVDESEATFDEKLKAVAGHKPKMTKETESRD